MRPRPRRGSLRDRLFRSHLLVMVVAVGVIVLLTVVLGTLVAIVTDGYFESDAGSFRKGRGDPGPFGLLALLGVVAAAVIAASTVGWRMARRLATPMEELSSATRQMADGNYDVRVPASGVEELDRLADAVNALAEALADTEARRLRLIGDIAHELRTPLSTIEGSMEALMDGVVPADDETYAGIAREAARLRRLAGDLSALSSSAELDPLADPQPVDVGQLVRDVCDLLAVQAEAKGIELDVDVDLEVGATLTVQGDADRLVQVITNVIGNAIQYSDQGEVSVRVSLDDARLGARIEVRDQGRGLAPAELDRIFERFYRVDEHYTDGTGVGLTIARQLVWAHGGEIEVSSPGHGLGTTVTIQLPAH